MNNIIVGYNQLLSEIKTRIKSAQYDALRAVNKELIALYWDNDLLQPLVAEIRW